MKDQSYSINEAREDYIARMRAEGFEPSLPGPGELQIDIDSEDQHEVFARSFDILRRECCIHHRVTLHAVETPSRSGLPSRHIRIQLPFEVDTWQRIAWQAALGSDPVRELLSCWRAKRGDEHPTLLIERQLAVAA